MPGRVVSPEEIVGQAAIPERLELLRSTQHWEVERRLAWRREALDALVQEAAKAPLWAPLVGPGTALEDLPLLDRRRLAETPELLRSAHDVPVLRHRTSGSSGRAVAVDQGPDSVGFESAARLRHSEWWELGTRAVSQVYIAIRSTADAPLVSRSREQPPQFAINPYRLDPIAVGAVHAELREAAPLRLVDGVSAQVAAWAELCLEAGVDGRELGVEVALIGGEMVDDRHRSVIEEAFGCRTAVLYGSMECRMIASECPHGSLHVNEELFWLELLDEAGGPVAPGEVGEVVVTPLHGRPMPLLRYRLGDVAAWMPGMCACGRTLSRLDVRLGRQDEMARRRDGTLLHPRFFRTVYEAALGESLVAFHTLQTGPGRFVAELTLAPGTAAPEPNGLAREAARFLGEPVDLRVEVTEARSAPLPHGKRRSFTRT